MASCTRSLDIPSSVMALPIRALGASTIASRRCWTSSLGLPSVVAMARARCKVARRCVLHRSNIAVPSGLDACGSQPGGVLLVDGLTGHVQRLGDACPRPVELQRLRDVSVLEPVGELAKCDDGAQPVGRVEVVRDGEGGA